MLSALGYPVGPSDGVYGSRTKSAIEAYQRKKGLPVDGKVSPLLLAALKRDYQVRSQQEKVTKRALSLPKWSELSVPMRPPSREKLKPSEIFKRTKRTVWAVISLKASNDQKVMKPRSQGSAVAVSSLHLITNCHVTQGLRSHCDYAGRQ